MKVITEAFDVKKRQIILDCQVSIPSTPLDPNPPLLNIKAIVDTGCTVTSVSRNIIDQLAIPAPCGTSHSFDGASGEGTCTPYIIDLYLPKGITVKGMRVDCLDNMKPDMLLGMDILLLGDISISTGGGKGKFSFQVPATHSTDFEDEINKYKKIHLGNIRHGNNMCPCGSGRKWENCHGR